MPVARNFDGKAGIPTAIDALNLLSAMLGTLCAINLYNEKHILR